MCSAHSRGAAVASAARIGWSFTNGHMILCDNGDMLDLMMDPPIVITAAVEQAVRRWRTAQVLLKFPSAVPEHPCYIAPTMDPQWLHDDGLLPQGLVDPVGNISSLLKKSESKQFAPWERAAAGRRARTTPAPPPRRRAPARRARLGRRAARRRGQPPCQRSPRRARPRRQGTRRAR